MLAWCVCWWHWHDSGVLKCPSHTLTLPGVVTWTWWDRWRGSVYVESKANIHSWPPRPAHTTNSLSLLPSLGLLLPLRELFLTELPPLSHARVRFPLYIEGPELHCGESFLLRCGSRRVCPVNSAWTGWNIKGADGAVRMMQTAHDASWSDASRPLITSMFFRT